MGHSSGRGRGGEFLESCRDGFEAFVQGGGSGGEADGFDAFEPLFADVIGAFNVVGAATVQFCGAGKLGGVVGISPADGEDEFRGAAEFIECFLTIFRGMTNGVVKDDFDLGSLATDLGDEGADFVDGLGGLGDDAEAFDVRDFGNVFATQDDAGVWEIALKAANFDVAFFANDDGEVTLGDEFREFSVGNFDERAGGVEDLIAGIAPAVAIAIRGAVGGDDDMGGWRCQGIEGAVLRALGGETGSHGGVVGELAEDGGGLASEETFGGLDGLADAEAHAGVLGDEE